MTSGFRESIDPNWREFLPRDPHEFLFKPLSELDESLPVVDRLIAPQTMVHFLEFAFTGTLPTGETTSLPLMTPEIFQNHLVVPYSAWAPGPHDKFGASPFDHAQIRIGSTEDDARLVIIEKGVHAMKCRLWEGVLPMSENRWQQKKLDDPDHHLLACRHLGHVIEVFSYFQDPQVLLLLCESYSLIHEHFCDFDRLINNLPAKEGQPRPFQLAALWEVFMTAHYTVMTTRAHSWIISKIQKLRNRDIELLGIMQPPPPSDNFTNEQLTLTNRIQDFAELALRADYTIFVHMPNSDPPSSALAPSLEERRQHYGSSVRDRARQQAIQNTVRNYGLGIRHPINSPASIQDSIRAQIEAQDQVRRENRGEPRKLPPVGWIQDLKVELERAEDKRWGYAAYRLTYEETDEEWAEFVKKLNDDLKDWGEGEDGVEAVKDSASIQWFDGKELGIGEGDIEGARKHFATLHPNEAKKPDDPEAFKEGSLVSPNPYYSSELFLVIDSYSYASYTHGSPFSSLLLPGDTGGFVIAVDVRFDPNDRGEHAEESPNYTGQLRVLGNLVYGDLYAQMAAQAGIQRPEELWPLAMNHPELVYTGPTVKAQVDRWKQASQVKFKMMEIVGKHIKEKAGEIGESKQTVVG